MDFIVNPVANSSLTPSELQAYDACAVASRLRGQGIHASAGECASIVKFLRRVAPSETAHPGASPVPRAPTTGEGRHED